MTFVSGYDIRVIAERDGSGRGGGPGAGGGSAFEADGRGARARERIRANAEKGAAAQRELAADVAALRDGKVLRRP